MGLGMSPKTKRVLGNRKPSVTEDLLIVEKENVSDERSS